MDAEEANKFINSLVKKLQVLCHGHVNFNNSVQVIGHLYLNVDSDINIDYIVNEKVCKNDNSSTVFVSNSYHSEPFKKKPDQESTKVTSSVETYVCDGYPTTEPVIKKDAQRHHILWPSNKTQRNLDKQLIFHSQSLNTSHKPHSQVTVKNQFCDNKPPSQTLPYHSPNYMCNDDRLKIPEKQSYQVMPDLNMDLSKVKTEPVSLEEVETNDSTNKDDRTANCSRYQDFPRGEQLDELMSEDFLIGLKDKTNKNITSGMHQGASNLAVQFLANPVASISSSTESFNEPGTSSNNSSFSHFKSSSPVELGEKIKSNHFKTGGLDEAKVGDKVPYTCKVCDKSFTFQTSLRRHIREKHLNIRFVCPQCGMTFTQKVSLFNHVENRCHGATSRTRPRYKPGEPEHNSEKSDIFHQPSEQLENSKSSQQYQQKLEENLK